MRHWDFEGSVYFVTTTTYERFPVFSEEPPATIVIEALQFLRGKGYYRLYAYVRMPDHLHIILYPQGDIILPKILHSLKSFTANQVNVVLGRTGTV